VEVEAEGPEATAYAMASELAVATLRGHRGARGARCREVTAAPEATVDTVAVWGMAVCSTFDVKERFEEQTARSTFAAATERQVPSDQIPRREEEDVAAVVAAGLRGTTAAA
jgi:hypothetical protein